MMHYSLADRVSPLRFSKSFIDSNWYSSAMLWIDDMYQAGMHMMIWNGSISSLSSSRTSQSTNRRSKYLVRSTSANCPSQSFIRLIIRYFTSITIHHAGICFGHQIVGRALGGSCIPHGTWELGPSNLNLSEIGKKIFGKVNGILVR